MKMDQIDMKIIRFLEENSRMSFRGIAKKLGLTPMAVVKRVKKLEKVGIIKKYTIILDPEPLGYTCNFCIFIRIKPGYNVEEVGRIITDFPETYLVNIVTGDYDLIIITKCRNKSEIKDYIFRINNIEGVERVNAHFIIKSLV